MGSMWRRRAQRALAGIVAVGTVLAPTAVDAGHPQWSQVKAIHHDRFSPGHGKIQWVRDDCGMDLGDTTAKPYSQGWMKEDGHTRVIRFKVQYLFQVERAIGWRTDFSSDVFTSSTFADDDQSFRWRAPGHRLGGRNGLPLSSTSRNRLAVKFTFVRSGARRNVTVTQAAAYCEPWSPGGG